MIDIRMFLQQVVYEDSIPHLLTSNQLTEESIAPTVSPIRTPTYVMTNELQIKYASSLTLEINIINVFSSPLNKLDYVSIRIYIK